MAAESTAATAPATNPTLVEELMMGHEMHKSSIVNKTTDDTHEESLSEQIHKSLSMATSDEQYNHGDTHPKSVDSKFEDDHPKEETGKKDKKNEEVESENDLSKVAVESETQSVTDESTEESSSDDKYSTVATFTEDSDQPTGAAHVTTRMNSSMDSEAPAGEAEITTRSISMDMSVADPKVDSTESKESNEETSLVAINTEISRPGAPPSTQYFFTCSSLLCGKVEDVVEADKSSLQTEEKAVTINDAGTTQEKGETTNPSITLTEDLLSEVFSAEELAEKTTADVATSEEELPTESSATRSPVVKDAAAKEVLSVEDSAEKETSDAPKSEETLPLEPAVTAAPTPTVFKDAADKSNKAEDTGALVESTAEGQRNLNHGAASFGAQRNFAQPSAFHIAGLFSWSKRALICKEVPTEGPTEELKMTFSDDFIMTSRNEAERSFAKNAPAVVQLAPQEQEEAANKLDSNDAEREASVEEAANGQDVLAEERSSAPEAEENHAAEKDNADNSQLSSAEDPLALIIEESFSQNIVPLFETCSFMSVTESGERKVALLEAALHEYNQKISMAKAEMKKIKQVATKLTARQNRYFIALEKALQQLEVTTKKTQNELDIAVAELNKIEAKPDTYTNDETDITNNISSQSMASKNDNDVSFSADSSPSSAHQTTRINTSDSVAIVGVDTMANLQDEAYACGREACVIL